MCRGAGEVRRSHGFLTVAQPCPKCRGAGQLNRAPCHECRGEGRRRAEHLLSVKIPAGIEDRMQLRISGEHARAQALDESRVDFHCPDAGRALEQTASEKSESRADLDDLVGRREIEQADNRIDHALVNQEILSAAFSRPPWPFRLGSSAGG